MKKPVLAVDVDGVVVDYFTPFLNFSNNKNGLNLKHRDIWSHGAVSDAMNLSKETFLSLMNEFDKSYKLEHHTPIDLAIESLENLDNHFDIVAITGRRVHLENVTKKFFSSHAPFIKPYFAAGRNNLDTPVGRRQKLEIAEELDALYLIDDNDHEFIHWDSDKVKPIIFAQPWNKSLEKSHPHIPRMQWKGIKKHLMDDISKPVIG